MIADAPRAPDRPILPHRSYRTLVRPRGSTVTALICAALGSAVVLAFAGVIANASTSQLARALTAFGVPVTLQPDRFLHYDLQTLHFSMPSHSWVDLLLWIVACALVVVVCAIARPVYPPLRYFLILNALVVGGEATYLYFTGHLGYDSDDFSQLMLHTAIATWVIVPPLVALFAALFPFGPLAIVEIVVCSLAFEIVLSMVRYGTFVALLSHSGPILMSDLYLQFGPLFDVIPLIGILTLFLVPLARRMQGKMQGWVWL
ncbi:MAG TPA: hypothetical protein VMD91_08700 [Candidatus Sulfotelmatobacter sp.]|nr:hypothetical protein [Candidatus Sulfotelmatobacter sp.]